MIRISAVLHKVITFRGIEVAVPSTHPFVSICGRGVIAAHAQRPVRTSRTLDDDSPIFISDTPLILHVPSRAQSKCAPEYIQVDFDIMDSVRLVRGELPGLHNVLHIGGASVLVPAKHDQFAIDRKGRMWAAHGIQCAFDLDMSHALASKWTLIGTTTPPGFPRLLKLKLK